MISRSGYFGICEECGAYFYNGYIWTDGLGIQHSLCYECAELRSEIFFAEDTNYEYVDNDMLMIEDESFRSKAEKVLQEILAVLDDKRHDYGDSFEQIWDLLGPRSALPRLFDKMYRLKSLLGKKEARNESIEDTFKDIIGYCILSILKLRGEI